MKRGREETDKEAASRSRTGPARRAGGDQQFVVIRFYERHAVLGNAVPGAEHHRRRRPRGTGHRRRHIDHGGKGSPRPGAVEITTRSAEIDTSR